MSEELEAEVRSHCERGDFDAATSAAIRGYGQEVFSFLMARLRAEDRAGDVFSATCESLWTTMSSFEWRCSMRTWLYKLARSAAVREERSPANRRDRRLGLSQVSELVDRVRTRTVAHLRTEVKDEFQKLRDELDPEDQTLLILRIDRGLDWNEIARVVEEDADGAEVDDEQVKRAAARVRQRFQKLKKRLRELAEARGLLEASEA
jgi:RNA polymerase sigma-70 factor (ECF subfamily)